MSKPKPLALFFGEDENDTRALALLVRRLLPDGAPLDTKVMRKPPVLQRGAATRKRASMAQVMSSFARELNGDRPRTVVIAHRDCDDHEPAHIKSSEELERDLTEAGVKHPIAATPCWEIEAWWMLFPDALAQARGCWRRVDYSQTAVGQISNAKERLTRDLRPSDKNLANRCRDYTESDSEKIARAILDRKLAIPAAAKSASLARFRTRLYAELEVQDGT